jgi:hypothetical protein
MDDMGEHRPAVIDYRNRCGKRASRDALRALLPVVRSGRLMLDLRDARGQAKAKVPPAPPRPSWPRATHG